jgi:hypothetical protein
LLSDTLYHTPFVRILTVLLGLYILIWRWNMFGLRRE